MVDPKVLQQSCLTIKIDKGLAQSTKATPLKTLFSKNSNKNLSKKAVEAAPSKKDGSVSSKKIKSSKSTDKKHVEVAVKVVMVADKKEEH